jgi:hypothetical protein
LNSTYQKEHVVMKCAVLFPHVKREHSLLSGHISVLRVPNLLNTQSKSYVLKRLSELRGF